MVNVPRLLEVLQIKARKRGREWEAPCPVHSDTDPSWHIEDETGRWYCFGCTQGGSVGFLVEKLKGFSRRDAEIWLREHGISEDGLQFDAAQIGECVIQQPDLTVRPGFALPFGAKLLPFDRWPSVFREYYLGRSGRPSDANRWSLGYAVDGRLGGRIIFPCISRSMVLSGYSARAIDGSTPRYLTPAHDENPDPSVVFGEQHWEDSECVVVTEGAINALACERAGARNIAALSGSPISPLDVSKKRPATVSSHVLTILSKLNSFDRIVLAVDPDAAGNKVVEAVSAMARWRTVTRVAIPPGHDAATLSRDVLRKLLEDAGVS